MWESPSRQCIAVLQLAAVLKASPIAPGTCLLAFLCSLNAKFILEEDEVGSTKEMVVWSPGLAARGFCQNSPTGQACAHKPFSVGTWGVLSRDVRAGEGHPLEGVCTVTLE